ncbi:MAG: hypothetical protein M3460_21750 [Actinomycetota bacterium]|nr:hypothetical protein [Actinomycetota bacterium]
MADSTISNSFYRFLFDPTAAAGKTPSSVVDDLRKLCQRCVEIALGHPGLHHTHCSTNLLLGRVEQDGVDLIPDCIKKCIPTERSRLPAGTRGFGAYFRWTRRREPIHGALSDMVSERRQCGTSDALGFRLGGNTSRSCSWARKASMVAPPPAG